jgi:transcriptional regulator with XRE-family HTH domain
LTWSKIIPRTVEGRLNADEDIGSWIRRQMVRREWSAADLSRRMGASSGRISEWMSGKRRPSPESCLRLADAFGVDPDVVLTLAGHRVATEPLPPDDTKSRIIDLVRRVNLSQSQAEGLEAMLTAWLELQRSGQINGSPNGT